MSRTTFSCSASLCDEVAPHAVRGIVREAREVDGRALGPVPAAVFEAAQQRIDRYRSFLLADRDREAALQPGPHAVKISTAIASGTQPPWKNFSMLDETSMASIAMKNPKTRMPAGQPHFQPRRARLSDEHAGHQHRAGDGDAIGRGKVRRRLEGQDEDHDADHLQPVDRRHVDLPELAGRRVLDVQARAEAEQGRLLGHREGA